ncbi:CATRA conflict system CASPASE/TPR repeat-associated protein [Streptomyces phaeofaciens]|uniref:CATRA conflict system CASPASE/TPR repeat-associated protein n=1 Tax=Streptomyces phaeofaciens TaxID=68254 RepID=UPI00368EDB87
MTAPVRPLADQELVVHVYAPTDGPLAKAAYRQIQGVWDRCRDRLGMVQEIPATGLPATLPPDADALTPGRPAAAIEDRAADHQAVVRREHDVVNLSLVFAAPQGTATRRLRIGSASPPGWVEFDRWWAELAADGTDALLGVVHVCQAKFAAEPAPSLDMLAHEVRAVLPGAGHAPDWWRRGTTTSDGFAVWEVSPDDDEAGRRVVVLAPEDRDAELSAWTWSRGDPAMPPLARYLMHTAKLRHQARVRDDGARRLRRLVGEVNDHAERVRAALARDAADPAALARLRLDEADLTSAARDLRAMRRTVEIAAHNMTAALAEPWRGDRRLAEWLVGQLGDDTEYVEAARELARDFGRLARQGSVEREPDPGGPPAGADRDRGSASRPAVGGEDRHRVSLRVGFAVDVERYSSRTSPQKLGVQQRLAALTEEVLDDLGHRMEETDHQGTGDGINVFLPARAEPHRVLPGLLTSWRDRLAADNARFRDRMRLRLATGVGPVGLAALGFSGATIVEVSRMLDSAVLRGALVEHLHADLAVLVSDQLYAYVVGEGYPGLDAAQFVPCAVEVKDFRRPAWLWVPE